MKLSYLAAAWLAGLLLGMEMDVPLPAVGLLALAARIRGSVALAVQRLPATVPVLLAAA